MRILIVEDEAGISRFLERAMRSEGFATERGARVMKRLTGQLHIRRQCPNQPESKLERV